MAFIRFLSIKSSNSGVLLSTIAGVRRSRHDLIFFLDGDDIWTPQKISNCVQVYLSDSSIGLVTHDVDFIDSTARPLRRVSRSFEVLSSATTSGDLVRSGILRYRDYVWLGSAYSVSRSKSRIDHFCQWAEVLPDPVRTYQDWPLAFWSASIDGIKCGYAPHVLMSYRIHSSNYSGDASTPEKIVRNLRKGFNTVDCICSLASSRRLEQESLRACSGKRNYYQYLLDLYEKRPLISIIGLLRIQPFLIASGGALFVKEWIRFFVVLFLGVRTAVSLTRRRY